jgi:AhpD family alkylhydroperoxidase
MSQDKLPGHYRRLLESYPRYMEVLNQLGEVVQKQGPLEGKTAQLVQLAAAVALGSEGAVHSHTRRALAAGASPEEIRHSLILLTSTLGFPKVSAALSWAEDVLSG